MLDRFSEIKVESPIDKIIRQIRAQITSGNLKPGDRLPSERMLAEKFGVGRSVVRDALRKLEFYGILKTHPQSGTEIAGMGITALESLISDVLEIEASDFASLVETRVILEIQSASLAAKRRTDEDIRNLNNALDAYTTKLRKDQIAIEEDFLFHLKIAEASKNKVLKSLMLVITPDIIKNYAKLKVCDNENLTKTIKQHQMIVDCIVNQDSNSAEKVMKDHLVDVLNFSRNI